MNRKHNFSAGPAALPLEVLEEAAREMTNLAGAGMSVMEMSHRSKLFESILDETIANLREILGIPDTYKILFLHGGATLQFSMVPFNLYKENHPIEAINTGVWSKKAIKEFKKVGTVNELATSADKNFTYIPKMNPSDFNQDASFAYITSNNTIYGTQYHTFPTVGNVPLVADMSSDILCRPINVEDFGLIFGGAQKNVGPSGLGIVIVREDLIEERDTIPSFMSYKNQVDTNSLFNTPNTWGIYLVGLVMKWIKKKGGLTAIETINKRKAQKLYDYIDSSPFYTCPVAKEDRSIMNVVFRIGDNEELEKQFVKESDEQGLVGLKGHRLVGGLRASIYNAVPEAAVDALLEFMKEFEHKVALQEKKESVA